MPRWQWGSHQDQDDAASPEKAVSSQKISFPYLKLSHVGDAKEEEDDGVEEGGVEDAGRSQGEKPQGSRWEGAENIFLFRNFIFKEYLRPPS